MISLLNPSNMRKTILNILIAVYVIIFISNIPAFAESELSQSPSVSAFRALLPETIQNAFDLRLKFLHDPDTNPTTYSNKEDLSASAWIAATGDLMFHSPQIRSAYDTTTGTYDFTASFQYVKPYLSAADITLGNFESTASGAEKGYSGYPAFNAPDETLDAIKWAGFDFLSTANNHSLDKGISGLERTLVEMDVRELRHSGTFMQSETDIPRYILLNVNGINLAIVSLTYGTNGMENALTNDVLHQSINRIDEAWLEETLTSLENKNVDATVVFIHWGNEYQRFPSVNQTALANKMLNWGADIILGSHPHVIQHSEIVKVNDENKFIIYSMGNFISNQNRHTLPYANSKYTENGVIVYLQLTKDLTGTRLTGVKYVPTWVYRYYGAKGLKYEILPIEKQAMYETLPAIANLTANAYEVTMDMMSPLE